MDGYFVKTEGIGFPVVEEKSPFRREEEEGDNSLQEKREFSFPDMEEFFKKEFERLFPNDLWTMNEKPIYLKGKKRYSKEELSFFKKLILFKIDLFEKSLIEIESNKISDFHDRAVQGRSNSFNLENNERIKSNIVDLQISLRKIHSGKYGICEKTKMLIHPKRLFLIPSAKSRLV